MRTIHRSTGLLGWMVACLLFGCTRDLPPEIPEFKPPLQRLAKLPRPPEPVADASESQADEPPPRPESKPEPEPVKPIRVAEAPAPEPEPEPQPTEAAPQPTLLGTWRVTQMMQGGQAMPMPEEMEMTLTFAEGGTVTMSMSGGPMPEAQSREGSYELNDTQVTISLDNETKTGSFTFEGTDQVTLDFDEVQMVLTR